MTRAASTSPMADAEKAKRADLRVLQDNERTLLSWMRTGLAMIAFGFLAARIGVLTSATGDHRGEGSVWVGVGLMLLACAGMAAGGVRYIRARQAILSGRPILPGNTALLAITVGLVLAGAVLAAYVLVS